MYPDVREVREEARRAWERFERRRIGVQERIGQSVPWWLVLIAGVFYLLSAPHTAATFDKLTPGWGWAAPVGVEFGLLYAAFRHRQQRAAGEKSPRTLRGLEMLLFGTAVIVNGAGSFVSVVEMSGLESASLGELWSRFGGLPAPSQVALLLVPLAALIIPVGTGVAGEGLAALILERREVGGLLEARWRVMQPEVEFFALRDAAIGAGISPAKAIGWAARISGAVLPGGEASGGVRPALSAPSETADKRTDGRTDKRTGAAERVRTYLETHPEAAEWSARALAEAVGVGKTTAADVLQEVRGG